MSNEFTTQDEIIFIIYDDVIKSSNQFIIKQILQKYRSHYDNYLDLSKVDKLDDKGLDLFCLKRRDKNIFHSLAKVDFDCNKALHEISQKFDDMYLESELLVIGKTLGMLIPQKFTKKIYIYTKEYDKRIHLDIQMTYKDMDKVNYVTGPLIDVINSIGNITSYILADIMDVTALLATDKIKYTSVLVANMGYNYVMIDNKLMLRMDLDEFSKEKIFKFATFMSFNVTKDDFDNQDI